MDDDFDWIQWRGENGEGGPPGDRGMVFFSEKDKSVMTEEQLNAIINFGYCLHCLLHSWILLSVHIPLVLIS